MNSDLHFSLKVLQLWIMVCPPVSILLVVFSGAFLSFTATASEPPSPQPQSPLQVLATEAPNAASWALAPLGQMIPSDIRQNLTLLKEGLADEAKAKPVATANAYQLGFRLCAEMIAALDQRDIAQVRAGYRTAQINNTPLVTSQALDARRNYQMSWPQYAREQDQRAAVEKQTAGKTNVQVEELRVQWAERAAISRRAMDTLYSQYRDALRATPALPDATVRRLNPANATPTTATVMPVVPASAGASNSSPAVKRGPEPSGSVTGMALPSISNAPGGGGHLAFALDGKNNLVFGGPSPGTFTAEEMQIVEGLKIDEIGVPQRRGLTYFNLYTAIDNRSPLGALAKELGADIRVLCVDADGVANVTFMSKRLPIVGKGPQFVELAGRTTLQTIRLRNNNSEIPKNAYVAFKLNDKVFREVLLGDFGEKEWWLRDELIRQD